MSPRYPLEAARTLRESEESEAREQLARQTRAMEAAQSAVESAERRATEHRDETLRLARAEAEKDAAGRSVADSLRARAYLEGRRGAQRGLDEVVERARAARTEAATALEAARQALAEARARREAVEKHHAAWLAERQRQAATKEEAEIEDAIQGRRRPPR